MTGIGAIGLRAALATAAERFRLEESRLNALDGAIGDGDHGITVRTGFDAICSQANAPGADAAIETILHHAGQTFMNSTGGAMGAIFGRMLIAAGKALRGCARIGPAEFHIMLVAMEAAVSAAGKVVPGDKTILDAIHAAAEAAPKPTMEETLRSAARQASLAATATAPMICRVGRASRLGERAIGHPDPGAVSFSLFLEALADWFESDGPELSAKSPPDVATAGAPGGAPNR